MDCMPKAYVGLIGAMAFLGAALSCFVVPALGDKYGRYTAWYITIWLQLPLYIGANLTDHLGVVLVMCFFLGFGLIGRFACGFLLFTESVPEKNSATFGTMFMVFDVLATLYVTFFLRYISNSSTDLIWIGFVLNVIACIVGWWVQESPVWLVSIDRKDEAIKRLNFIAKMNGVKDFFIDDLRGEKFETIDKVDEKVVERRNSSSGAAIDIEEDE